VPTAALLGHGCLSGNATSLAVDPGNPGRFTPVWQEKECFEATQIQLLVGSVSSGLTLTEILTLSVPECA